MSAVTPLITGSDEAPDSGLERSLTNEWDAKVIDYPNEEFPFNEWILNRVRGMGYKIDDLSYLHESVPQPEVYKVTKQLCADTNLPEFRRMLNRFVREVIVPKGKLRTPIAVQRFMNVRIMLPTTPDLFFAYHTGLLYGHGIASRSIWLPFVDVTADEDRTRSMQIVPIRRSRELVKYAMENKLSMEEMTELFAKDSFHIKAGPGSCCLFTQQHIHGSGIPNDTGKTRVSMDFRVAEGMYGDLLGRKIPAGYMHLIPETEQEEERLANLPLRKTQFANGKPNIFYVANNTASTFAIPVHLQRYMLNDYCAKNDMVADYEVFDLEDMMHLPTLWNVIETRNANVVMFSIFALPEEESERNRLLETAITKGNIIHFVNEGLSLSNERDLEEINSYLSFAKYGKSFLPIGLPVSQLTRDYFDKWSKSLSTSY
ncbi:MAG: sporadic carbohydrate cluster protein (TIGR04323 family) [Gammaproteobacteria bacterium]|jgi:sporadic carbohydrate cluster protein (TIGR04323 family)